MDNEATTGAEILMTEGSIMEMRKKMTAAICAVALTLTVVPSGAVAGVEVQEPVGNSLASSAKVDDVQDVFRAVVFFQGPYADRVLSLKPYASLDESAKQSLRESAASEGAKALADAIIDEIQSDDPQFFAKFAKDVQSGRPSLVDGALSNAQARVERTKAFQEVLSDIDLDETYIPGEAEIMWVAVAVGAVAVIAVAVLAVGNAVMMVNVAGGANYALAVNWQVNRSKLSDGRAPVDERVAFELAEEFVK